MPTSSRYCRSFTLFEYRLPADLSPIYLFRNPPGPRRHSPDGFPTRRTWEKDFSRGQSIALAGGYLLILKLEGGPGVYKRMLIVGSSSNGGKVLFQPLNRSMEMGASGGSKLDCT